MKLSFVAGGRYVIRWYGRRLTVSVVKVRFDDSAVALVDGRLETIWPEAIIRVV